MFGLRKINVNRKIKDKDLSNANRAMDLTAIEFGVWGLVVPIVKFSRAEGHLCALLYLYENANGRQACMAV
jgi:hypothetical protein